MLMRAMMRRAAVRGGQQRLSVFIFHRVLPAPDPLFPGELDVAAFDTLLGWIGSWFQVLPLDEALARLDRGGLPPAAAAITFDDGYADNLHHAAPVLQRHGMTATLFIATGFLDGGRMWNDSLIEAVRAAPAGTLDLTAHGGERLVLGDAASRAAAIERLIRYAKHLPPARRQAVVDGVVDTIGVALPRDLMLRSADIPCWLQAGHGVGAHTVSHPILASLDAAKARREIHDGRDALQALCGRPVTLFAYPNGKPGQDYGPEHVRMAREAGFAAAVSTAWGHVGIGSDRFQLPRFTPWDRQRLRFGLRLLRNLHAGTGPAPA